jgi:hypothetical protein
VRRLVSTPSMPTTPWWRRNSGTDISERQFDGTSVIERTTNPRANTPRDSMSAPFTP